MHLLWSSSSLLERNFLDQVPWDLEAVISNTSSVTFFLWKLSSGRFSVRFSHVTQPEVREFSLPCDSILGRFCAVYRFLHINWIVVVSVTPLFDNISFQFVSYYDFICFWVFCTTHLLACGTWHHVYAAPLLTNSNGLHHDSHAWSLATNCWSLSLNPSQPCEFCGGLRDSGRGLSLSYSVFLSQYHSTSSPHWFIHYWYCTI